MFKRLKGLSKLPALKTLPDLAGNRKPKDRQPDPNVSADHTSFDPTDDTEDRLASELHSRGLAKKVLGMKKREFPYGTVPELLAIDFLRSNNEQYVYQAQLYGGFRPGGIVPDILLMGPMVTAILINGNYWHNLPGMKSADESDKYRMLGTSYEGRKIKKVVMVWESRLMRSRDEVMRSALQGIEMGP